MITHHFVTATRDSLADFKAHSPLAKSLIKMQSMCYMELHVASNNRNSLANAYNPLIDKVPPNDILIFIHDDVSVDDWWVAHRLSEALQQFDIVGVAGNTRRQDLQQNWVFNPVTGEIDTDHLSGAIYHGKKVINYFGKTPSPVKLLDGVFIACRASTLQNSGVRFDPQFPFHFYDLDFSRSCEKHGLTMGTWPIALTHQSAGKWGDDEWNRGFQRFLAKWGS